jgi:hypothetical protein
MPKGGKVYQLPGTARGIEVRESSMKEFEEEREKQRKKKQKKEEKALRKSFRRGGGGGASPIGVKTIFDRPGGLSKKILK